MHLNLTINPNLLISHALFSPKSKKLTTWEDLKNQLWDKYRATYEFFLYKNIERYFVHNDYAQKLQQISDQTPQLFTEVQNSHEFSTILNQTTEYQNWLQKEWNEKKDQVTKELLDILKLPSIDTTYTVFVMHPLIGGGTYLGDQKILWGHEEEWPNYSMVYLMHEVLHDILGISETSHYIIELATDQELRTRLNHSQYFIENDIPVGYPKSRKTLEQLLPTWNKYLTTPQMTLKDLETTITSHQNKVL